MLVRDLYDLTQKPWGGATIDPLTRFPVPDGIDVYAVSLAGKYGFESVSIPETANYAQFMLAYDHAQQDWEDNGGAPYVGVFHDDAKHTIDIDPIVLAWSEDQVNELHRRGYPVTGGAYHFTDGQGYWPGYKPPIYN